jgi:hypothetical protein
MIVFTIKQYCPALFWFYFMDDFKIYLIVSVILIAINKVLLSELNASKNFSTNPFNSGFGAADCCASGCGTTRGCGAVKKTLTILSSAKY